MVSKYDLDHPFPLESGWYRKQTSFLLPYDFENKIKNYNILSQVYDKIVTKLKVEGVHCNLCSPLKELHGCLSELWSLSCRNITRVTEAMRCNM